MRDRPQIGTITPKLCDSGHSCIQEVDNLHSQMEKKFKNTYIFEPFSLFRVMLKVNRDNPFNVLQMKRCQLKNYNNVVAKTFIKSAIP